MNYNLYSRLNKKELNDLNRIVTMYLDYAEMQKEYDKFKLKQDKGIVSDFDKFISETKLLEEIK